MLPTTLQTSPYLTCVLPGQPSPVVYMTDTLGPEYPVITEPGDAAFGVIGLDRQVVWHRDPVGLTVLEAAAGDPVSSAELVQRYGPAPIAELVSRGWLQAPAELCAEYRLVSGEIEVTAHCNWGCSFCPVATDPKPRETMPMPLFTEIIDKLSVQQSVDYVTFHFFNEPTLDKHFADRVRVLQQYGMKLALYTNASALTPDKVALLAETGVLRHLIVNLPTLDEQAFAELTHSRTYAATVRNLDHAVSTGAFPVSLAVNGIGAEHQRAVEALRAKYEPLGVEVNATQLSDRAGALENEYHEGVVVSGRLRGCNWPLNHAYFSVRGDLFICCNDYYQREVFGNVADGSLHEIMTSEAALRLRRRVFGIEMAPQDYICRSCHDQKLDFPHRQFRPLASFPLTAVPTGKGCGGNGC